MSTFKTFAETRPILLVLALFVAQAVLPFFFVVPFKVLGLDILPLRLIIPVAESALMVGIILHLGWQSRSGLVGPVRNVRFLIYPAALAFLPVVYYGSIEIAPGWVLFYLLALLFTGISEEAFARGLVLPALLSRGKWAAVLAAAALFSAGHITNIFFEEFGLLEWIDKFAGTFGFAVLYGAVFLRTGSLWPLVFLHMLHDYMYLTSGTAGPFVVTPFSVPLGLVLAALNVGYGGLILAGYGRADQAAASR